MAISEAVEAAASSGGTKKYSLGSVLNHVLMHQTVIGLEAKEQLAGVFVVDVAGIDRALEISRPLAQYSVVEVRPVMEDAGTEM